ncbi:V-set domain-containing T-cell activation inhibitor 1-like [Danio rerio]|uniref:V-set domain-containing T-cell activation inhibitor 1-like n=1 Tax=Danio rerio TaxID=7955 RepID=A0AC58II48_DANRE
MIIRSQCFICMLAVFINTVSPLDTVEGVIGGSVVLPCSSAAPDVKFQDCIVFWRHNNSKIVYEIVKGKDSLAEQDQQYKDRTDSFPMEYSRRNFSIKLNKLQHMDTGEFNCFITPTDEYKTVQLIIKDQKRNATIDPTATPEETSSSLYWLWILLPVAIVLIASIIIYWKKTKAPSFSGVTTEDPKEH